MTVDLSASKRIAVTGATGFLGTALVERLLRCVPNCEIVLLVRPGKKSSPEKRAKREIFRNDAFDTHLKAVGKDQFWEEIERRVTVIAGDVGTDGLGLDESGRSALKTCDTVIHSAATVSFDAALDTAVEVNLLGPTRIAKTLQDLESDAHLVAVSTCYVAGNRRGKADEELLSDTPFHIDVDWRQEVKAARRVRSDSDAESRTSAKLSDFRKEAEAELGAAGTPLLAAKTEQIRQRWAHDQLVEAGRARAKSLGWPDAYAYTKALGERALHESKGSVPVSIVRPSIIESAWAEPKPGWIKGFRMAEPIIISYARGLLKAFPGVPEGIVDVIPVDLVVAAIINVTLRGHDKSDKIDITQVASGSRNPLHYRRLVTLAKEWFTQNPVYDSLGQPIAVPEFTFPGRNAVEKKLDWLQRGLTQADKSLKLFPLRGKKALLNAELEDRKNQVDRAAGYVKIYGSYAECEALYGVDNLLGLHNSLSKANQKAMGCDPQIVDWDHYVTKVHLPSIIKHARVKTTPTKTDTTSREARLRKRVLAPERQIAAFDFENTIVAGNVVSNYAWLATQNMNTFERGRFTAKLMAEVPSFMSLDKQDRTDFLRHFYRRYEGFSVEEMARLAPKILTDHILPNAYPAALRRIREHKRLGHHTVLVTGALDIVIEPLKPLFDYVICSQMTQHNGRYSGELLDIPPTGEVRAQRLREYAKSQDIDLGESVAYGDSPSDLPLLDAVGFPVAVNPETRLASTAMKRGWLIEYWTKAQGGNTQPVLPLSPLPTKTRSSS